MKNGIMWKICGVIQAILGGIFAVVALSIAVLITTNKQGVLEQFQLAQANADAGMALFWFMVALCAILGIALLVSGIGAFTKKKGMTYVGSGITLLFSCIGVVGMLPKNGQSANVSGIVMIIVMLIISVLAIIGAAKNK